MQKIKSQKLARSAKKIDMLLRIYKSTVLSTEDEIRTFCRNNNIEINGLHLFGIIIKAYLFLAEKLGGQKDEFNQKEEVPKEEEVETIESTEDSEIQNNPEQYLLPSESYHSNNSRKRLFDEMETEQKNTESKVQIVSTEIFEAPFEHELDTVTGEFMILS